MDDAPVVKGCQCLKKLRDNDGDLILVVTRSSACTAGIRRSSRSSPVLPVLPLVMDGIKQFPSWAILHDELDLILVLKYIKEGGNVGNIAQRLEDLGLIKSTMTMRANSRRASSGEQNLVLGERLDRDQGVVASADGKIDC